MQQPRTFSLSAPARLYAARRAAIVYRCIALLLALLLLGQPLLTMLHCHLIGVTHQHDDHSPGSADEHNPSSLHSIACTMDDEQVPREVAVPALWPGLLPLIASFAVATILIRRINWVIALQASRLAFPTTPPPPR